jgi:hypothetical protein
VGYISSTNDTALLSYMEREKRKEKQRGVIQEQCICHKVGSVAK